MSNLLKQLNTFPANISSAADYRRLAQSKLDDYVWNYLEGSAGHSNTHEANKHAFDALKLIPRPLVKLQQASANCHLFGQSYAHPIFLAPIAYQRLFHSNGELATALAANAQQGQMIVSSLASQTLEAIIEAAQQPLWFQLYWQGSRDRTLRLVQRAITAGYSAIIFTVDAPVKQTMINLPADVSAINQEAPLESSTIGATESMVFEGWMAQAPTWEDLVWLRHQIKQPLIVKGILHPNDALRIEEIGCEGLVVSNHGGRILDGTPSSFSQLASIKKVLSAQTKIFFDSGVRTGQDAYKAFALGADIVMLGRPYVWGLAAEGALGVAHVLRIIRDELEMTMALTGVSQLNEI
ncbi:MAG: alpha-hydroxy acid oxidase [Methylophilaceae bacterium]